MGKTFKAAKARTTSKTSKTSKTPKSQSPKSATAETSKSATTKASKTSQPSQTAQKPKATKVSQAPKIPKTSKLSLAPATSAPPSMPPELPQSIKVNVQVDAPDDVQVEVSVKVKSRKKSKKALRPWERDISDYAFFNDGKIKIGLTQQYQEYIASSTELLLSRADLPLDSDPLWQDDQLLQYYEMCEAVAEQRREIAIMMQTESSDPGEFREYDGSGEFGRYDDSDEFGKYDDSNEFGERDEPNDFGEYDEFAELAEVSGRSESTSLPFDFPPTTQQIHAYHSLRKLCEENDIEYNRRLYPENRREFQLAIFTLSKLLGKKKNRVGWIPYALHA